MTSEKIIVLVCDKGDSKHGEISMLDDPQKAERLVETLLEAGFEADRIRVFAGRTSEFQISHRPVVALVDEHEEGAQPSAAKGGSRGVESRQPAPKQPPDEEPAAAASVIESGAQEEAAVETTAVETKGGKQSPAAEMATPVRFSSLFRSA